MNTGFMNIAGKKKSNQATGFTLIEVLIAMALMVAIAGIAATFFTRAVDAAEANEKILEDVNNLETVWQLLATDTHHVIDRQLPPSVSGPGDNASIPTFMGGSPELSGAHFLQGEYTLRFVRDGWANPLNQVRSDMQRVGYLWIDGQLWRNYWAERNQPYDTEPSGRRLLAENITAIRIRFLPNTAKDTEEKSWVDSWPPSAGFGRGDGTAGDGKSLGSIPAAFEITLTLEDIGDVRRIFALPGV